jgi:hypothetical protein
MAVKAAAALAALLQTTAHAFVSSRDQMAKEWPTSTLPRHRAPPKKGRASFYISRLYLPGGVRFMGGVRRMLRKMLPKAIAIVAAWSSLAFG